MNEKIIWDYLMGKVGNQYGVAALMGNLYVESHLNPRDLQGSYERKLGMNNETYTAAVDDGSYPADTFIHDSAGYGLAQWTYWSRKKSLYDFAQKAGKSIGDLKMQLDFLWGEIQSYKTVVEAMKNWRSLRDISDIICKKYLKPANQAEYYLQNRANFGQGYYDNFAKEEAPAKKEEAPALKQEAKPVAPEKPSVGASETVSAGDKRIVAKVNVNIRAGNGTNYAKIGLMKQGASVPWIASSANGWHAFAYDKRVCWVSGEFVEVK